MNFLTSFKLGAQQNEFEILTKLIMQLKVKLIIRLVF